MIDLVKSLNQKYWYDHQSPGVCKIGSDGVGHDLIHPMDKLQAACRNAMALYHGIEAMKEDVELKELDLADVEGTHPSARASIKIRRFKREIAHCRMQIAEREQALNTYYAHIEELLPAITARYAHFDDALPEIWACRVAYNAMVKNHPLGQDFKVALLSEAQKTLLAGLMQLPKQLQTPNADTVVSEIEKLKGATEWQKTIGSNSDQVTHALPRG